MRFCIRHDVGPANTHREAINREVRGDVLRTWNQNGLLPLIYAHLFSLELIREIFGRQVQLGKGPVSAAAAG